MAGRDVQVDTPGGGGYNQRRLIGSSVGGHAVPRVEAAAAAPETVHAKVGP